MTPTTPLFANSQYIYYCNSAIDLTGNGQNNELAGFYTGNGPSSVGPVLVYANPPNGMTGVPLNSTGGPWNNTSLMLLFNEPVASESMANITFTPAGGSAEPIAVYAEDGNYHRGCATAVGAAAEYHLHLQLGGRNGSERQSGLRHYDQFFTTGTSYDYTNPTATAATPANNATGVGVNAPIYVDLQRS